MRVKHGLIIFILVLVCASFLTGWVFYRHYTKKENWHEEHVGKHLFVKIYPGDIIGKIGSIHLIKQKIIVMSLSIVNLSDVRLVVFNVDNDIIANESMPSVDESSIKYKLLGNESYYRLLYIYEVIGGVKNNRTVFVRHADYTRKFLIRVEEFSWAVIAYACIVALVVGTIIWYKWKKQKQ